MTRSRAASTESSVPATRRVIFSSSTENAEDRLPGAELTANCPHATQAMAEAILAQAQGYQYRMFSATDAALDPAAELGDAVFLM